MGSDPAESVADGRGELHDTKGVWIGDASAFPTAPGVNPMISIMSLAHRTAGRDRRGGVARPPPGYQLPPLQPPAVPVQERLTAPPGELLVIVKVSAELECAVTV